MASFTNSDVAELEEEIASAETSSEVIETVDTEESTAAIGFEVEAVEPESTDIEQSLEPAHAGDAAAESGPEATPADAGTTAEAKAYFATEETHVAFAIEEGEPNVGDSSAFVFDVVEPEESYVAPESTVQEREWVEGEFLLRETTPEEHVVVSASESDDGLPVSMLEEFAATEAAAIEDPAADDIAVAEVTEANVFEQPDVESVDDGIETNRVDESTD